MVDTVSVLYVDPNRAALENVASAFERDRPELSLLTAESATEARDRLEPEGIDCVVSEYDLPDASGLDLLRTLHTEFGLSTVLVTDRDDDSLASEVFSSGIDEYVHRTDPIQPTVLAHRIDRAVSGSARGAEESIAHLRALTHAASDVIVTADDTGTVRFANEAADGVFGYRPEELIGEPITTLVAEADAPGYATDLKRYLDIENDEWGHAEIDGRHRDGSRIPLEVSFGRFEHAGRRFFTGIVRDVSERERLQSQLVELVSRITGGFFGLDPEWRFTFLNERAEELINPEGADLIGENIWKRFPEALDTGFEEGYRRAMETQTSVSFEEYFPPLSAWFDVQAYPSESGLSVFFRDITDRKRREQHLETLNEVSQELTTAETVEGVNRIAIEAVDETLSLPIASIKLYDPETGYLEPIGGEDSPAVGHRLFDSPHNVPWRVFVDGEPSIHDDLSSEETPLRSAIILPLGDHGVLIAGADEPDAISESDVSLAEILAANTTSALDRVDRERALHEQTDRLEQKNAALRRVHRLNAVIRGILRELTRASTHEEAMQSICDRFADADPYRFAWIGTHDPATDEITPEAFAGVEEGYLDEITVTVDERSTGQGPAGRAFRSHEPQIQNDLYSDPPFEPWRQAALERGYRASISVPIVHRGSIYGVLNLYADEVDVFDETERTVLAELGEAIGYAFASLDQRQALVSDQSIDLEFRIRDPGDPVLGFVRDHGLTIEFENTVYRADGTPRVFVTIPGVDPERVERFARESDAIEGVTFLRKQGDDRLFACTLADSTLLSALIDHGAFPRTLASGDDGERIVVRVSGTAAVRSVVDLFDERYDEAELVAQRERDEPIRTQREFKAAFDGLLTERQEEVLRAATVSGFFEWPRDITAQQLADAFDVSQPTVSRHIRAGERTLFELLFDGTDGHDLDI